MCHSGAGQVPQKCIWCHATKGPFNDNHIIPQAIGNDELVLPRGLVCSACNEYFGRKVEPVFLDDPVIHALTVMRRMKNIRKDREFRGLLFDPQRFQVHLANQRIDVKSEIWLSSNTIRLDIELEERGSISKTYTSQELSVFSRAVHKIGFEYFANSALVKGLVYDKGVYGNEFDHVRAWARHGSGPTRPVLRYPGSWNREFAFHSQLYREQGEIAFQLDLTGERLGAVLSGDSITADEILTGLAGKDDRVWKMSNRLS